VAWLLRQTEETPCSPTNVHVKAARHILFILWRGQPLLWNRPINNVMQPVSRQWIGKHVPVVMNTNTTWELLLEMVSSTQSVQRGYLEDNWGNPVQLSVEGSVLQWRQNLSVGSWRSSTARSRCLEWLMKTAGWKKASQVLWWFVNCGY
jgi:hypothetical protein